MNNKYYNGFASKEQYLAVKKEIEKAIVNSDALAMFEVGCMGGNVSVYADGLSFNIDTTEWTITNIECEYNMGMFEVDMIEEVYKKMGRVISAYIKYDGKEDRTYELKTRVVKL